MAKVPEVWPAAIVMVAGTEAGVPDEVKPMERPPVGAALEMVTVPVEPVPATTVAGLNEIDTSVGAVIVSVALADWPFAEAPIVLEPFVATGVVVIGNVAVVLPAAIVTVAPTVAAPVDVKGTARPPVGAALRIVTVPVEPTPPTTDAGLTETPVTVGAVTVSVAVSFAVPSVAVIVSVLFAATATVLIGKVAVVLPAATVTLVPTDADGSLEARETIVPPVGATPVKVTVPVAPVPPTTDVGAMLTALSVGALIFNVPVEEPPVTATVMVEVVLAVTAVVVIVNVATV
jgi:hypothetical protein